MVFQVNISIHEKYLPVADELGHTCYQPIG